MNLTDEQVKTTIATLPGNHGLDCAFYQSLFYKTIPFREEVYITFKSEGAEFRPISGEHSPNIELVRYQHEIMQRTGVEQAYGEGALLEVLFSCYCPPGSDAADRGLQAIQDALEEMRGMVNYSNWQRTKIGMMYSAKALRALWRAKGNGYRPPARVLPSRPGPPHPNVPPKPLKRSQPAVPPKPSQKRTQPAAPPRPVIQPHTPTFEDMIRARLKEWGMAEDYDRMLAERRSQ